MESTWQGGNRFSRLEKAAPERDYDAGRLMQQQPGKSLELVEEAPLKAGVMAAMDRKRLR